MKRRRFSIKKILQDKFTSTDGLGYIWLFVALFVCLSLLLWNIGRIVSKGYREKEKVEVLLSEVKKLEEEHASLEKELAYAKSDVAGEEGARNILGMSYEGEEVIFVNERKENRADTTDKAEMEGFSHSHRSGHQSGPPYWKDWIQLVYTGYR